MRSPAAAAELATAALARLDPSERSRARLPAVIASAGILDRADLARVAAFWVQPARPADPAWRLASALLGGEPLRRIAAASVEEALGEPPEPHTGAMCAATGPALAGLAIPGGLPPEDLHVTVGFWPEAAEDVPLRETVNETLAQYAANNDPITGLVSHVAWLGGPDVRDAGLVAVALEVSGPGLHQLHQDLAAIWATVDTAPSARFAYRPHITLTYIPETDAATAWPEGPLPVPVPVTFTESFTSFGDTRTRFPFLEGPAPVTAAAVSPARFPLVQAALDELSRQLNLIDRETTTEARTAIELGFASALDRVGRMVTRAGAGNLDRRPALVAAAATTEQLETVNPAALIAPAVSDTVGYVTSLIERSRIAIEASIGDNLHVDLSDVYTNPVSAVSQFLEARMTETILARLGSLSEIGRIDPTDGETDSLKAPFQITRDTLAFAAGARLDENGWIDRDEVGRPLSAAGGLGTDSLGAGPDVQQAINDALTAHAPQPVTGAAAPRSLKDLVQEQFAEVGQAILETEKPDGLQRVTTYVWRINWNGTAQENLPEHKVMDGTEAFDLSDTRKLGTSADLNEWPYSGSRYPGDHPYCHCGWETTYTLLPLAAAVETDFDGMPLRPSLADDPRVAEVGAFLGTDPDGYDLSAEGVDETVNRAGLPRDILFPVNEGPVVNGRQTGSGVAYIDSDTNRFYFVEAHRSDARTRKRSPIHSSLPENRMQAIWDADKQSLPDGVSVVPMHTYSIQGRSRNDELLSRKHGVEFRTAANVSPNRITHFEGKVNPEVVWHENGHVVARAMNRSLDDSSPMKGRPGSAMPGSLYEEAMEEDIFHLSLLDVSQFKHYGQTRIQTDGIGEFGAGDSGPGVSNYAASVYGVEDFAESWRLYVMDKQKGGIGEGRINDEPVTREIFFDELFPNRAFALDAMMAETGWTL